MKSSYVDKQIANLSDSDLAVRRAAAIKLGRGRRREAVAPLCNALRDESWFVRRNAARALGRIGDPQAVLPLCAALKDRSIGVCRESAVALGKIGDAAALEPLCRASTRNHPGLRADAVAALIALGKPAVAGLCRMLRSPESPVRSLATIGLKQMALPASRSVERSLRKLNGPRLSGLNSVVLAVLGARDLTPQERWLGLEALRQAKPRWWTPNWLGDTGEFCEGVLRVSGRGEEQIAVRAGARAVLDYISLGRAAARDTPSERETLLRGAQPAASSDGAGMLLRASEEQEQASEDRRTPMGPIEILMHLLQWLFHRGTGDRLKKEREDA